MKTIQRWSKSDQTNHIMILVGNWIDLVKYYKDSVTGEAWCYNNATFSWSNLGDFQKFLEQMQAKRLRGELEPFIEKEPLL